MKHHDKHWHQSKKEWYHSKGTCLNAEDFVLNAGDYVIPFSFVLPDSSPSSFNFFAESCGPKATIRHFVRASIRGLDDCALTSHK